MLVALSREALRPLAMNTTISFLSPSWCIWGAANFVIICFTLGALWPPVEPEEDKGGTEEPAVYAPEQLEFDWALTWLEEDGPPIMDEDKALGLLFQVFQFSKAFSSLILFWCFLFWLMIMCQN